MKEPIAFAWGAAIILILSGFLNCAKTGPPPGGPVDNTPPQVLLTEPADGDVGVHPPHRIAVHFSEKVNKRSVEQGIRLSPEAEWIRFAWEENLILIDTLEREVVTLTIESDINGGEGGGEDVTVGISGFSTDRRGNALGLPYIFTFTAGDSLPAGEVSGKVSGAKADRKAPPVTVRALSARHNREALVGEDDPGPTLLRLGEAASKGEFHLAHLPVGEEHPFFLMAHRDDNENGLVDLDFEYYGYSDTLTLTETITRIDSLELVMVYADTPASLRGRITSSHSLDSTLVYLESVEDSSFLATVRPDSTGDYSFPKLLPGGYEIRLLTGSLDRIEAEGPDGAEGEIIQKTFTLRPGEDVERYDLPVERVEVEPADSLVSPGGGEEPQVTP